MCFDGNAGHALSPSDEPYSDAGPKGRMAKAHLFLCIWALGVRHLFVYERPGMTECQEGAPGGDGACYQSLLLSPSVASDTL